MLEEDKGIHEFDRAVRSMLEDAQEEVPARVWSRISARLGGAGLYWRRAAYALAAAAVLAAGFFIAGTSDRSSRIDSDCLAVVSPAQDSVRPEEATTPARPYAAEESATGTRDSEAAVEKAVLPAGIAAGTVVTTGATDAERTAEASRTEAQDVRTVKTPGGQTGTETSAVSEESAAEVPASRGEETASETKESTGDTAETVKDTEPWSDPFAELESGEKSRRSAGKPSIYIQGTIDGNDSDLLSGSVTRSRLNSSRNPASGKGGIVEKSISVYGVPVSLGAGVNFPLSDKLSIGTGMNWSMLVRSFQGEYTELDNGGNVIRDIESDITHTMHYIGVPLNMYYNFINNKTIRFYAWCGALTEYAVSNRYRIAGNPDDIFSTKVKGMQLSAGFGAGVEFSLSKHLGLYFDPSARYYFPCNQPKNIRTDRPLMVSFEAGLRFNL